MKEIIEIYSKIIVATFGFIGPSFTLLISIFIESIEKSRAKNEQQLKTIESLYADLYKNREERDMEEEMKKILKKNKTHKKQIMKELNLLNPRRQIKRVFIPLILSIIFIAIYYFARTKYCNLENSNLSLLKILVLAISGVCFAYCLFVLWQILNMVIEAKQALIKDRTDKVVKQENILEDKN
ncbi:hypothetical protein [Flavobacterium litorale]|uniref:Uncharacterized protein n=1 Tax=Flavobacterium litorale TaxID=2856519 RepID=A0ABX8V4G1_9FLAO|nr:hypothetical protein [Flavobacterium litorale]QYJ67729.1 hypothetical protein K1I41_09260 [Flavobacterium litorale]